MAVPDPTAEIAARLYNAALPVLVEVKPHVGVDALTVALIHFIVQNAKPERRAEAMDVAAATFAAAARRIRAEAVGAVGNA